MSDQAPGLTYSPGRAAALADALGATLLVAQQAGVSSEDILAGLAYTVAAFIAGTGYKAAPDAALARALITTRARLARLTSP